MEKNQTFFAHPVLAHRIAEMLRESGQKANMQVSPTMASLRVICHACKVGSATGV